MDNEQLHIEDEQSPSEDEYDYNREPPLDEATATANRARSKYVFTTLCFLAALVMFFTYLTHPFGFLYGDWFPLVAALVLAIMGVVFLRSPDRPPASQATHGNIAVKSESETASSDETLTPFEELVQEAIATLPDEFHEKMQNVMVHVAYEPDAETLTRVGVKEGYTLLGLYEGVPLTVYGRENAPYPEMITIYQRTIEDHCQHDPERIRDQVHATVLHEIAHHFGMGHEEMPIWVK